VSVQSKGHGICVGGICAVWVQGGSVSVNVSVCFRVFGVVVFLLFVGDLCPFFGFIVYWLLEVWVKGRVVIEFPGGGVVDGDIFVEVFRHAGIEVVAVFSKCGAEAVSSGVAMSFAINAV